MVRVGAQQMIRAAVEAELKSFLEGYEEERDGGGRRAVVRNGYQPEREVLTGGGTGEGTGAEDEGSSGSGAVFSLGVVAAVLAQGAAGGRRWCRGCT